MLTAELQPCQRTQIDKRKRMKYLILSIFICLNLTAQNYTNDKKIDMHGGNHSSLGGYSSGGFRTQGMNMSAFLDKNSSKTIQQTKSKK